MAFQSQQAEEVASVAQSVQNLSAPAQVAAVNAVIGPPDAPTTKIVWIILVGGLVAVLLLALGGLIYLLSEELGNTDTLLTVFTSVLTGLVGLFAPSPVNGGNG